MRSFPKAPKTRAPVPPSTARAIASLASRNGRGVNEPVIAGRAPEQPVTAEHVLALTRAVERLSDATRAQTTVVERAREPDYIFIATRSFDDRWSFTIHRPGMSTSPMIETVVDMANAVGQYLGPALADRVMATLRSCSHGSQRRVTLTLQADGSDWRVR